MKLNWNLAVGLQILLENNGSLTCQELMNHLGISKTQAYDRLSMCRYYLKYNGIPFFSPKRKGSIQLDLDAQKQLKNLLCNNTSQEREFSTAGRKQYLFFELWRTPYLKNHQICSALDISRNTCISDMAALSEELQRAGFNVGVSSSVNGYALQGDEASLRKALVWELSYVGCWTHPGESYPLSNQIGYAYYGLPYEEACSTAESLAATAARMNIFLSSQSCFLIATVLLLWMERWHGGKYLRAADVNEQLTGLHGQKNLYWLFQETAVHPLSKLLEEDLTLREVERAEIVRAEIEELIRASICITSIYEEYPESLPAIAPELESEIARLVPAFEQASGNRFPNRILVEQSVRQYMHGALSRMMLGYVFFRAEDPLIHQAYRYLLELTRSAVSVLPILSAQLSDNELIGLALQYIGWMSGEERESDDPPSGEARVGIVCASTVGVGGLLQAQMRQFFPEVSTCIVPLAQLDTKHTQADFFISNLTLDTSAPYLQVNALLTTHDRYRIQKRIDRQLGQAGHNTELLHDIQQITRDFVDETQMPFFNMRLEQLFEDKKIRIVKERSAMLTDLITQKRIQCVERVEDWKAAIRLASLPLLEDESIRESYVDAMVESVESIGPYIVLAPGIALPHARPEAGVNRLAMALLRTQEPVYFDGKKYANLFFVLASADGKSHMNALIQLSHIFGTDGVFETFMSAEGPSGLFTLLNRLEE